MDKSTNNMEPKLTTYKPASKLVRNMSMDQDFTPTNYLNISKCSDKNADQEKNLNLECNSKNLETINEININNGRNKVLDKTSNTQFTVVEKLKTLHTDSLNDKLDIRSSENSKNTPNTDALSKLASQHNPSIDVKKSKTSNLLIANKTLSLDNTVSPSFLTSYESPLSKLNSATRPIYPDVPYSPYSSPRTNRKRVPLRESKRVSIERQGSFLQLNQYKLMESIGQGSYGLVKLAYSEEDSTHYAMKILSKRRLVRKAGLGGRLNAKRQYKNPLERIYREIAVLKKLDHPNVVKLIEVLDDPLEDSLYLVFELVKNGEILHIPTKTPLSEERARECFRDVILGVEYLHYQCIIHGDLKPANLLLGENGRIIIADLGVCDDISECNDDKLEFSRGTPAFRSPESLQKDTRGFSGKAADIWSLGVTLFALVFGDVPFKENSLPALYESIQNNPLVIPETPKISDQLKDLLISLLNKNPLSRLPMSSIRQHSWITNDGKDPLPSENENCSLVYVTDEELQQVVTSVPKLDTLILIKTMLKKHSFQNPFLRNASSLSVKEFCKSNPSYCTSSLGTTSSDAKDHELTRAEKTERFVKAGRSNSAPIPVERNKSAEIILPSVEENAVADTR